MQEFIKIKMSEIRLLLGDCLIELNKIPDESIDCCITSPPYWGLRNYGVVGQLGLEKTPEEYVAKMVKVFREVKRVLKKEGTLWLNLGDSYAGSGRGLNVDGTWNIGKGGAIQESHRYNKRLMEKGAIGNAWVKPPAGLKSKDLVGIPWRVAFALQTDGWYLRQDIIWHKPNPMPESVKDRCTKAHEYIFLLSKNQKYYFDGEAIKEKSVYTDARLNKGRFVYDGKRRGDKGTGVAAVVKITENRNKRSVWTVTTKPFKKAHFATFPRDLILPCVLAGCPSGGGVYY